MIDERTVRQQLDSAIGRALFEPAYAARLLADPVGTLRVPECSAIHASSMEEFARQARELFWGPAFYPEATDRGRQPGRSVRRFEPRPGRSPPTRNRRAG